MKVGDEVRISGDIRLSNKIVYVTSRMKEMINNGNVYRIAKIQENDKGISLKVNGYYWGEGNIVPVHADTKSPKIKGKKIFFDIDQLVL